MIRVNEAHCQGGLLYLETRSWFCVIFSTGVSPGIVCWCWSAIAYKRGPACIKCLIMAVSLRPTGTVISDKSTLSPPTEESSHRASNCQRTRADSTRARRVWRVRQTRWVPSTWAPSRRLLYDWWGCSPQRRNHQVRESWTWVSIDCSALHTGECMRWI